MTMRVHFDGFTGVRATLHDTTARIPVSPLDVARAAALTCGPAPALDPLRRLMRLGAFALEILAHLDLDAHGNLAVVGLEGLEPTAKSELSQRLGVGIARVVAETADVGLVDLYALHALSRSSGAPMVLFRGPGARRPDFVGADASGSWSVLEAKGRSATGTLKGIRAKAHSQAQGIDFQDLLGRPIPIDMRIGSVARLNATGVDAWFEDPPAPEGSPAYAADPDELLYAYYQPVRDLIDVYGSRLRGVSGATKFGSAPLPGTNLSLAVHRRIAGVVSGEPDVLRAARAELQDEIMEDRLDAVAVDDRQLSIGRDGLALLADSEPVEMVSWFRELREL
jgi:hypothetical protein